MAIFPVLNTEEGITFWPLKCETKSESQSLEISDGIPFPQGEVFAAI